LPPSAAHLGGPSDMTQNSVFEDFLRDIEPSATTKAAASAAHSALRRFLAEHEDFRQVHRDTYLSGSYRRDTAIRPRTTEGEVERPDVDVITITNHTLADNPGDVVDLLYRTLKDGYANVRKQQRSVRVMTEGAVMDVVPIIAPQGEDGPFYIPDRSLQAWIETNPRRHTQWTTEMNKLAGGRFKPLVKLMKWWRRENPTVSRKPKGFVIECITAECMDRDETHYGRLFVKNLERIVSKYAAWVEAGIVPHIDDPGVPGHSVTEGMTFAAFEGFYRKTEAHAERAREAMAEEDADKATALWRAIFGDRFPRVRTTATVGLLGAAATPGPAVFPDRPIRPNKPAGFA
jgi:hypothetical protein